MKMRGMVGAGPTVAGRSGKIGRALTTAFAFIVGVALMLSLTGCYLWTVRCFHAAAGAAGGVSAVPGKPGFQPLDRPVLAPRCGSGGRAECGARQTELQPHGLRRLDLAKQSPAHCARSGGGPPDSAGGAEGRPGRGQAEVWAPRGPASLQLPGE